MIVCSCNLFSDVEVRVAFSIVDPPTIAQVYRHLGHEPSSGRCVHTIREIMNDEKRGQVYQ
jgi:bacterioferritin-associated ferredoxin